jgi:hypothetical protein
MKAPTNNVHANGGSCPDARESIPSGGDIATQDLALSINTYIWFY